MSARNPEQEYFQRHMKEAKLEAQKSKDPKTQVGAVIVNENDVVIARGHNHMPFECFDTDEYWIVKEKKKAHVIHSETDALWNGIRSGHGEQYAGSTLFVTLLPCSDCAKQIIKSGIKRVVYCEARDKKMYRSELLTKGDIQAIHFQV